MVKIDIITGFLGAGKTTFISMYAKFLKNRGEKLLIIENEFGAKSIDSDLLGGENFDVLDISGGCACCSGKNQLIRCIMAGIDKKVDRIIIEPSGMYNLDTFFELFDLKEISQNAILNGIITIVKPDLIKHRKDIFDKIIYSQFLSPGAIVFSDTQNYSEKQLENSLSKIDSFIQEQYPTFDLRKVVLYSKSWSDFTDDDLNALSNSGRSHTEHMPIYELHIGSIDARMFLSRVKKLEDIDKITDYIFKQNKSILRVKGFFSLENGKTYSVNCTDNCSEIKPCEKAHPIFIVLGQNIDDEDIKSHIAKYAFIPKR